MPAAPSQASANPARARRIPAETADSRRAFAMQPAPGAIGQAAAAKEAARKAPARLVPAATAAPRAAPARLLALGAGGAPVQARESVAPARPAVRVAASVRSGLAAPPAATRQRAWVVPVPRFRPAARSVLLGITLAKSIAAATVELTCKGSGAHRTANRASVPAVRRALWDSTSIQLAAIITARPAATPPLTAARASGASRTSAPIRRPAFLAPLRSLCYRIAAVANHPLLEPLARVRDGALSIMIINAYMLITDSPPSSIPAIPLSDYIGESAN